MMGSEFNSVDCNDISAHQLCIFQKKHKQVESSAQCVWIVLAKVGNGVVVNVCP